MFLLNIVELAALADLAARRLGLNHNFSVIEIAGTSQAHAPAHVQDIAILSTYDIGWIENERVERAIGLERRDVSADLTRFGIRSRGEVARAGPKNR